MGVGLLCFLYCVGSGLCDELIARSEQSHRMCVCLCGLETSTVSGPMPDVGCRATAHAVFELLLSKYLVYTWVCIKYDILFGL